VNGFNGDRYFIGWRKMTWNEEWNEDWMKSGMKIGLRA
jgi:hypothetical protein